MSLSTRIVLQEGDALVIVDVQNDFLPDGALGIPHGNEVIPVLNSVIGRFVARRLPIVATRDWHPVNHCSFRDRGGPWPPHCVANTPGAAFAAGLHLPTDATVVSKAGSPDKDAYSGFDGTELEALLRAHGAKRLFVAGLATDYCVLSTVRDALARRFQVFVLEDAIRAVNVRPGDGDKAIMEMKQKGARLITMEQLT